MSMGMENFVKMVIPGPYSDSVGERWATGILSFFTDKPDNPDARGL